MSQRILMAAFLFLVVGASGCRTTPTLAEAPPHVTAKVAGDPEQIWTATRDVLLDQKLQIYVRDKRGMFIAYTPMKRFLIFFPRLTK